MFSDYNEINSEIKRMITWKPKNTWADLNTDLHTTHV